MPHRICLAASGAPFVRAVRALRSAPSAIVAVGSVLLLLTVPLELRAACAAPAFRGPVVHPIQDGDPQTFTLANIFGNGRTDLVVASREFDPPGAEGDRPGGLSIVPGIRQGFGTPVTIASGRYSDVAAADFDRDGDDDLVAIQRFEPGTNRPDEMVMLRNDSGRFTESGTWTDSGSFLPATVAVGDFNGDRNPDVVAVFGARPVLYRGTGDGSLQRDGWTGPEVSSWPLSVSDINRDGRDDLTAVTREMYGALVLPGAATGGFSKAVTHALSWKGYTTYSADMDGDGDLDLLIEHESLLGVIFDPTKSGRAEVPMWRTSGPSATIAAADFDGDGVADVARAEQGRVEILRSAGRELIHHSTHLVVAGSVRVARHLEAADYDGDGDADLVVLAGNGVSLYLNDGAGRFDVPVRTSPLATAIADFDGNGLADILQGDVLFSRRDGSFGGPEGPGIPGLSPRAAVADPRFALGDLNRDGRLDLVLLDRSAGAPLSRTVALMRPDGTFDSTWERFPDRTGELAYLADVDGDGILDFATIAGKPQPPFKWTLAIARGNGDGTFQPLVDTAITASSVVFGDFNGDQFPDVAFGGRVDSQNSSRLAVALNDGRGGFREPIDGGTGDVGLRMTTADVNGDGRLDVVGTGAGQVSVAVSRGDGTFEPVHRVFTSPANTDWAEVADFTNDGHVDILVAEETVTTASRATAAILKGDGRGRFALSTIFPTSGIGPVLSGDFDGDGRYDIIDGGFVRLNDCRETAPRRRAVGR